MYRDSTVTLSRYKLSQFVECPRCFWLRVRQGVELPKTLPFALNNAMSYQSDNVRFYQS